MANPVRTQLDLMQRLLTGYIEHRVPMCSQSCCNLQQQCRFANSGISANQDQRAFHNAASQYAVQFFRAGIPPFLGCVLYL